MMLFVVHEYDPKKFRIKKEYETYLERHSNDISPKQNFAMTHPFAERYNTVMDILRDYPDKYRK